MQGKNTVVGFIMRYAVAIDIGGTNTRVALVNENLEITDRQQFPTNPEETLGRNTGKDFRCDQRI